MSDDFAASAGLDELPHALPERLCVRKMQGDLQRDENCPRGPDAERPGSPLRSVRPEQTYSVPRLDAFPYEPSGCRSRLLRNGFGSDRHRPVLKVEDKLPSRPARVEQERVVERARVTGHGRSL